MPLRFRKLSPPLLEVQVGPQRLVIADPAYQEGLSLGEDNYLQVVPATRTPEAFPIDSPRHLTLQLVLPQLR